MTLEEYFGQGEYYFSESAQELLPLEALPFPRLYHSCAKLLRENGPVFRDTRLWNAFMERLSPSQQRIQRDLRQFGRSSCVYWPEIEKAVRSRFYHAARRQGLKVRTHKEAKWITAEIVTTAQIKVKGQRVV